MSRTIQYLQMVGSSLRNLFPNSLVKAALRIKYRDLVDVIKEIEVVKRGQLRGYNWVELTCGTKFFGVRSSPSYEAIFDAFNDELQAYHSADFAILIEIVKRYKYPCSVLSESGHKVPKYKTLKAPINGLEIEFDELERLVQLFKLIFGDIFVDYKNKVVDLIVPMLEDLGLKHMRSVRSRVLGVTDNA
jgi:hypothetical protein